MFYCHSKHDDKTGSLNLLQIFTYKYCVKFHNYVHLFCEIYLIKTYHHFKHFHRSRGVNRQHLVNRMRNQQRGKRRIMGETGGTRGRGGLRGRGRGRGEFYPFLQYGRLFVAAVKLSIGGCADLILRYFLFMIIFEASHGAGVQACDFKRDRL